LKGGELVIVREERVARRSRSDGLFGPLRAGYWLLLAIAGIEFGLGYFVGITLGNVKPADVFQLGGLRKMLPAWLLLPLLWFGYVALAITWRRLDRPISVMWRLTFRHRFWLLRGMLFTAMAFPLGRAFTAYKSAIPNIVPFYADRMLIAADRSIFGVDPWRLTHALIGPSGTVVIDRIYTLWFLVMMLLLSWLNFTRNQKLQLRGLLTYVLSWAILGNIMASAFASVGPCFYEEFYHSDHFAPLMKILRDTNADHRLFAIGSMKFLLDSVGKDRFGAGISAMPSLHVTIAFLCFLVTLEGTRRLWPKLLSGLFAMVILVGSVHLGWHYAVDGIVGIAAVTLIWLAAGRFVDWLERRPEQVASPTLQPAL
jgi:hypothetical protein